MTTCYLFKKKVIEINDIKREGVEVAHDDRELFLGWKLKLIIKATCVEQPFTSEISEFQKETWKSTNGLKRLFFGTSKIIHALVSQLMYVA